MKDQLPKKPKPFPVHMLKRPWIVEFDLFYDDGGAHFISFYRTKFGARISMWWNYYFASWGGSVKIYRNEWRGSVPPGWGN